MIHYDIAVIGGGIAGFTAALRSLEAGKKTVMISAGQSALHFSSGSIDVLGHFPNGEPVSQPFEAIPKLVRQHPEHPYAKVSLEEITQSLAWFQHQLSAQKVCLYHQEDNANHGRITPLGTVRPTWLSQGHVYQHRGPRRFSGLCFVAIEGYRDAQPTLAKDTITAQRDFASCPSRTITLSIPGAERLRRNRNELHSVDLSRLLAEPDAFDSLCEQLIAQSGPDELVILPAIIADVAGERGMDALKQRTDRCFHEVPTMPPSLLGIRIERALQRAFASAGGVLLCGDQVTGGEFDDNGRLTALHTRQLEDIPLTAEAVILATGSYFSRGLNADRTQVSEPTLGLDMVQSPDRSEWRNDDFFSQQSHPFMAFGINTDNQLRPTARGKRCQNLFVCGAVLSGYDPVYEGCGGGVAIATGYAAAQRALAVMANAKEASHAN
ncbi:anaerobic glycerol-3-phosphate dehydrogenase subunit B [Salinivibrio sp. PR5]|uniref:glycerol-3-phosphate dehydrogenase subunit GlpB n=1 Tax=Salinivibrio sp. PR5 TaxID=1909484 RepID=UPI00098AAADA|nr:glycerol-3-phosphate dehydrogenase subunit GlpB [Salinivibrio sp. PR5]OOF08930.1 anaerobic glycerol-3-phosphate dehydrogenase subunit B [Salinivibrio sp. PR5]